MATLIGIVLATIATMLVGMLWYGPLFGKQWMALMGIKADKAKKMKESAKKSYVFGTISSLVLVFVLAKFLEIAGATTIMKAAEIAGWLWLGFVATVLFGTVLWEGKPKELYFVNAAYQLVSMLVAAAVLVSI